MSSARASSSARRALAAACTASPGDRRASSARARVTSASTTAPATPAQEPATGGTTDTGAAGWTVTLPPGYERTREGRYRQADTGRELRIATGPGQPDAVADREAQAAGFAQRNPSYEQIRIEPVQVQGVEGADWEFTFEGLHVLNRVFAIDGTGHSLWLQTPEEDFTAARADFEQIVEGFSPVGG